MRQKDWDAAALPTPPNSNLTAVEMGHLFDGLAEVRSARFKNTLSGIIPGELRFLDSWNVEAEETDVKFCNAFQSLLSKNTEGLPAARDAGKDAAAESAEHHVPAPPEACDEGQGGRPATCA